MKRLILTLMMLLLVAFNVQAQTETSEAYDVVVDANGSVDAQIGASVSTIWVKSGAVTETIAVDIANTRIYFEPGFALTGGINVSASNCSLIFGPNCSVSGEIDVTTGVDVFIKAENGCSFTGLDINTANAYINGGGWGTLSDGGTTIDAINAGGDDLICENISAQTTAAGGSAFDGIEVGGDRCIVSNCKILDSDNMGFNVTGDELLAIGCTVLGSDGNTFYIISGTKVRLIGNYAIASARNFRLDGNADDSILYGNISKDPTVASVLINAVADNCVVVGNRVDDLGTGNGVVDNSSTSTNALNDETAF